MKFESSGLAQVGLTSCRELCERQEDSEGSQVRSWPVENKISPFERPSASATLKGIQLS
jgi:hypothetical protein